MIKTRFTSRLNPVNLLKARQLLTKPTFSSFSTAKTAISQSTRDPTQDIQCSTPSVSILHTQPFINGKFISTEESIDSIDPRTGLPFCQFSICNTHETNMALRAARDAYDSGVWSSKLSGSDRSKILHKLASLIDENRDYIALLETYDVGKPIAESYFDIDLSIELLTYYAGYCHDLSTIPFDSYLPTGSSFLEPIGVIGCIVPWNYPIMEMFFKVATALACGNTVVVKPPETAPLSCIYAGYLASEAGVPDGVLNIVPGYGNISGSCIVESNYVDKISFTGSGVTGRRIMELINPNKKLTLELGGKSAVIINDIPNECYNKIDDIVNLFIEACYANAGQVCTAPTRLFINENIYDEFVEKAVNIANNRIVGDPFNNNIQQGPVQNAMQCKKILDVFNRSENNELESNGPKLMCGGRRLGSKGFFIEPTVFAGVEDNNVVAREEIFGPTMQILKYSDVDDAIRRANNSEYGLAAGVFSGNGDICNRAVRGLKAGTVFVNLYDAWDASIPFGGYKQSGFGREKGFEAVKWFTKRKHVFQQMKRNAFV